MLNNSFLLQGFTTFSIILIGLSKSKRMKKKFFIFALMLMGISFTVVSCSNDDDDIILPPIEGEGWQTTDATGSDDIILNFRLTKSDGTPANTFRYGENICFDLMITNNTNDTVFIERGNDNTHSDVVLGRDLFRVYRSNGDYAGRPFENTEFEESVLVVFYSKKPEIRLTIPSYAYDKDYPEDMLHPHITGKWEAMNTLFHGSYYTEFTVWYYPTKADQELKQTKKHTFKVYFKVS